MKRNGWILALALVMLADSAFNLMMALRLTDTFPKLTTAAASVCMLICGIVLFSVYNHNRKNK